MKYNGWFGFGIGTFLFFAAPPLYRIIDPTAGQFDAGYIHPIIYAAIVVFFADALSTLLLLATAPGLYKALDKFFESHEYLMTDPIKYGIGLKALYFTSICATVWCMV